MQTDVFFDSIDDDRVSAAIEEAERNTSGEIRVFVSRTPAGEAMEAARREFVRLNMHRTAERNGVLIYIAPASQNFAILGDEGIHEKCGTNFWEEISSRMGEHFREGRFTEGLVGGILEAGEALGRHFPYKRGDKNELPNSIARD